MTNNSRRNYNGLDTIQIVLVILKIFNLIDWPWWKVAIPTYIAIGLAILYLIIDLIYEKIKEK